jgi:hypothetical protein
MNGVTESLIGLSVGIGVSLVMLTFWPRKGKWGINLKPVNCPCCGDPMPRYRWPANKRQAMWGGWNCRRCGCEMDKYGREFTRSPGGMDGGG